MESEYDIGKLDQLRADYGIHHRHFTEGLKKKDDPSLRQGGFHSVYEFFTNPFVADLLKRKGFSPKQMRIAIGMFSDEIGNTQDGVYFTEIKPHAEMEQKLASYIRQNPSIGAKKQLDKAVSSLAKYQGRLEGVGITPIIYGSTRYGDATTSSDLDCRFLSAKKDETIERVLDHVLCKISDRLGTNGFDDFHTDLIVDSLDLRATLIDVIDGEAGNVDDFEFLGNLFFPYGVIAEGLVPTPFDTTEVNEVGRMIREAADLDPFFELLLCYHYDKGIKKRKSKLNNPT